MEAYMADPITCSMASIKTRPPAPSFTQVFLNLCPSVKKTVRKVTSTKAQGCDSGAVILGVLGYGAATSEMVLGENDRRLPLNMTQSGWPGKPIRDLRERASVFTTLGTQKNFQSSS